MKTFLKPQLMHFSFRLDMYPCRISLLLDKAITIMMKVHGFVFQERQESGDRKRLAFMSGIPRKKIEIFTENKLSLSGYLLPS